MNRLPSKPELLLSLNQRKAYYDAAKWKKPFVQPTRFLKNRLWKKAVETGHVGESEVVATFHLPDMHVVKGENISNQLACYGFMEPDLTEAFIQLIQPGWTVLDIGMHIGYFTTLFALLTGEKGRVHAFEPTPSTYEFARKNTSQIPWIQTHPCALWSEKTEMTFHDFGLRWMAFNTLGNARIPDSVSEPQKIQVPCETLDGSRTWWDGKKVDLIKIDAESAEKDILKGGCDLIALDRPILTLEVGDENQEDGASRDLVDFMLNLNYEAWEFAMGTFTRHVPVDRYTYTNLIFVPHGKSFPPK